MGNSGDLLVAEVLRRMEVVKMNQPALARKCGITQSRISLYLAKKSTPNLENLDRIAAALETETWRLLQPPDTRGNVPESVERLMARLPADSPHWNVVETVLRGLLGGPVEPEPGQKGTPRKAPQARPR